MSKMKLCDALVDEIIAMSAEEVRETIRAEGKDPEKVVDEVRKIIFNEIKKFRDVKKG